ncbi:hypothetical protein LTR50_007879 [Elasticomyces elasticus]|nr:hypothetical protein LTR50_007879 [Elasticomyces elasticus]
MNNQQFRRLVLDTPARQDGGRSTPRASATPAGALGSKKSSFIPMTPRTVKVGAGVDFARQVAQRNASLQPTKKFRSSAAPKGTKLAAGYHDRTSLRKDDEEDDKAARIQALEEQVKLGQISQEIFEELRDQITGGDITATHLVKGLDRKLLERVRKGEDVFGGEARKDDEPAKDFDDELEKLEEKEVVPIVKEKVAKKGEMAPPSLPVAGTKRTRDAILAELKATRKQAKAASQPVLGDKFRKWGKKKEESRIHIDERGREVMIVVDADGNVKRKVRKVNHEKGAEAPAYPTPDKDAMVLGADVFVPPRPPTPEPEDGDDDIFEGVGNAYNPLGDEPAEDDSEEEEDGVVPSPPQPEETKRASRSPQSSLPRSPSPAALSGSMPPPQLPQTKPNDSAAPDSTKLRNYFNDAPTASETKQPAPQNPLADPNFLAAIKKAGSLNPLRTASSDIKRGDETEEEKEARLKKRAAMLATSDRDLEDIDMGFGSSRYGDEEGGEDSKIKLSQWKGVGADDDDDEGEDGKKGSGKGKRKRGPKKRKGDKNSAADVLRVIEQRKGGGK